MPNPRYRVLRELGREIEQGMPWPRPHCPVCESGYLATSEYATEENARSRSAHNHEAFEPHWISGTFSIVFKCESESCAQRLIAVGSYRVGYSRDCEDKRGFYQGEYYSDFCRLEYFSPPLTLLLLPEDVPEDVREAVDHAGTVLFAAPGLAGTALRMSLERFLTSQGTPTTGGNGQYLSLDARIREWRQSTGNDRVANLFLAVKWIGNDGAHEVSALTASEVLDGVELIDEAFHSLYDSPDLDARAQAINARKSGSGGVSGSAK